LSVFNVTNNNNNIALHCLENNNTKIMSRKLEELEGTLDRLSELHTLITPHEESEDDDEPSEHIEIDREALCLFVCFHAARRARVADSIL
jgi:hypothetical protein